ncbi:MAG: hypothetical protein M0P73_08605 [Syntrophobacterales bacterium]|jgi:hypothetical protein|nr:hypothetical protein [Syntrophobacterales bacterium]
MDKTILHYCATDKEIFDVLMSSKQQIRATDLLEWAKDRGIFYSPKDSRETLASNLSLLTHDYHDLNTILSHREHSGKAEKLTSVILNTPLTIDDIKEVSKRYKEEAPIDEKIITNPNGPNVYTVKVEYSEIDYSKTRLVQRRYKEADIEFIVEDDKTLIRMPANDKAREIVDNLKNRLDAKKKTDIPIYLIELTEFSPLKRTEFFTSLISKMPNFKLSNVTSVKVESNIKEPDENELELEDDQDKEQAQQEMLALVKNVALKGKSLLVSAEYQQLKGKGFFITSIVWRSSQISDPYPIIEFEAGFEDQETCTGFKYNVRGAFNYQPSGYTRTIRPILPDQKQKLLTLIEQTAYITLTELRTKEEQDTIRPADGANP